MKLGLKHITIALILSCFSLAGFGQNSPEAKKAYEKAKKFEAKQKYEKMFGLFIQAITEETALNEKADKNFIGDLYFYYARYFITKDHYGSASQFFYLSALTYQKGGFKDKAQNALQQAPFFEDSARIYQSQYVFSYLFYEKEYTRYPVSSILGVRGDTTWFTMNVSKRDSLVVGQTGWFLSIYDDEQPERSLVAIGQTTLYSMEFGKSVWYMVFNEDGKTTGFRPQVGDLNYLLMGTNPDALDGLIEQLTKYHTLFLSDFNQPLYSYHIGQMLTSEGSEEAVIEVMRDIVVATATSLYDPETSDLTENIDSGAFKGDNMWEAMIKTTTTDIKAYLRYVLDNPHAYMGRSFRIDEYYANWLIEYTEASDSDKNLYWDLYKGVETSEEWAEWESNYGRYLGVAAFDFTKVDSSILVLVGAENYDSALIVVNKWLALTAKHDYQKAQKNFQSTLAWVYQKLGRFDDAETIYLSLIKQNPDDFNTRYQLGYLYLSSENLTKALPQFKFVMEAKPEYVSGHGMYGWTLLQ
ncbi:MAG: tetratricopeptide (TPR) repeat protein [Bacteroidia bacterium]